MRHVLGAGTKKPRALKARGRGVGANNLCRKQASGTEFYRIRTARSSPNKTARSAYIAASDGGRLNIKQTLTSMHTELAVVLSHLQGWSVHWAGGLS